MSDLLRRLFTETWPAKAAKSAIEALMLPGQVAGGLLATQPEQPGMWSDVDEARQQITQDTMMDRTTDLAGLLMGGSYAAPAQRNAVGSGIRAYHGSPHDFDRFDLSKIGTGEGAQAYGHGLYFAESEGVAKSYRDALAKDMLYTKGGEMFDPQMQLQHLNVRVAAHRNGSDLDASIARAQELLQKASDTTRPMLEHDIAVLQKFKQAGGVEKQPGRMYEVNINARPEQFLDWDKPLSRQSPIVQPALRSVAEIQGIPRQNNLGAETTVSQMVDFLERRMGNKADATREFAEQGIPGIKYLDQGSRSAGEGSRNYVVFDDKLIDILRKYGLAGAAGPLGALLMGGGGDAQAQPTAP